MLMTNMEALEPYWDNHERGLPVFQPAQNRPAAPSSTDQLEGFKCSQCTETFTKQGALKQHFKTSHSQQDPKGPFPCGEPGCQFSSGHHQAYEAHLMSSHGLSLIPCTTRSCKASFPTRGAMESHRRSHLPFGCFLCQFASRSPKEMSKHLLEHSGLSDEAGGKRSDLTPGCTNENPITRGTDRPARKQKPSPAGASRSLRDGQKAERQEDEKMREEGDENDRRPSAEAAALLPSKEYLAEGSEHIYRTHTCPICRRCFKMRSHLQEHLHLHFPEPALQCPTCERYFTSKSKLRIHRLREAGQKLHRCHLCDYAAVERNAIRRHLAGVHAEQAGDAARSFCCPACGRGFSQSRALKAHMKTHNGMSDGRPLACFQQGCAFQSPLQKELVRHAAQAHGVEAVECRHHACSAVFPSAPDMEAHYRTHLAYHCSECDFSCSNKSVFLQHGRLGHPGTEQLRCDFCSYVTFNPVAFGQHMGHLHANEKIHRCPQCSFVTSHKRGLKRHVLMHSGEKPHKCKLCEFRCRDESYLSKHMLTHSDDKNYMCAECGYVTKWKHYLNVHMRKHAGDLRYSCDQCSYRCHRMDQLSSHKLRHQAKTLMCEICAYACKRKYELRSHMLAKHSGEPKQPAVHKCKYCAYSTRHRQALQNHENCKHTRLKEFRCALCSYSSFSSISLFLHKRKTHGYVPGDKAWLENYAAKERERSSTELMQDFYIKPSVRPEQPGGGPSIASDTLRQPAVLGSADDSRGTETPAGSQPAEPVGAFDVVNDALSVSSPTVNSPEEYCTLVLTRLPTPSFQNEEETTATTSTGNKLDTLPERTNFSSLTGDDSVVPDGEREHSDSDDGCQRGTGKPSDAAEILTSQLGNHSEPITPASLPEHSSPLESENRLTAMRKHDKEQAQSMVLEGRVQMLVLPAQDVYRCDSCSYVTRKETALKHHRQAACHGRSRGHRCQACGAHFKQKRGLESHLKRKCPAVPRRTRTFVGLSKRCQTSTEDSDVQGWKDPDSGAKSDQTALLSSPNETPTLSRPQLDSCMTGSASFKSIDHTEAESEQQRRKSPEKNLLQKPSASGSSPPQEKGFYSKTDGKFKCTWCSFASVRLPTVQRHVSTCRKTLKKHKSLAIPGLNDGSAEEVPDGSKKHRSFGCPSCAFRCNQRRALDRHERGGCMKPGHVQCTMCLFVAKSKTSLSRHLLYIHRRERLGSAAAKRLHCQHCAFSCKQERCMAQHVALKHKGVRPHRCRYCPFSTARRYRLEEHESLHTGLGRHGCGACGGSFGTVAKLRQHKARVHDRAPTHFCPLCDFGGYALDDVKRHRLRCHTGELRHVCTHCDAQFSSEVALRNHCKRVHQLEARFSCKRCDYTCSSDAALRGHQQNKHPQVKCATCQEFFQTKESLEAHQRSHLAHQCPLCPFAAKARQLLAQHLLGEHEDGPPGEKPLRCSSCAFACRHQLVFEQHLRSHGSKRLYKCTDCEYSTRNRQKITWHIRIHTGEKPYGCEQCSYSCADPSRLKLHMRVHQEEKKYLCPQCGYKCKWATQLKYHMTKHTGEKPHACDECDYRTNRADALRSHRDTQHCDTRPYVCEKCGKAFKTSFILKTHQRQHSDERPYACGLCQKAFRWPAGLRHHYLSHTKQQPFSCRLCSYRAKQKFQVVKHLRRHHPETPAEQGVARDAEAGGLTLREALQGTLGEGAAGGAGSQLFPQVTEEEEEEEEAAEDVTENENTEESQ